MNARLPVEKSADWLDDYPPATLPMLNRLTPAFDRVPLAEALARRCLLFRKDSADDRYIGVILIRWTATSSAGPRHVPAIPSSGIWPPPTILGVAQQAGGNTRMLASSDATEQLQSGENSVKEALSVTQVSQQSSSNT